MENFKNSKNSDIEIEEPKNYFNSLTCIDYFDIEKQNIEVEKLIDCETIKYIDNYIFYVNACSSEGGTDTAGYYIYDTNIKTFLFKTEKEIKELINSYKQQKKTFTFVHKNQINGELICDKVNCLPYDFFKIAAKKHFYYFGSKIDGPYKYVENGINYINRGQMTLYGKLYNEGKLKKYEEYDQKYKTGVEKILYHIKYVLCSGNEEYYEYFMNWIYNVVSNKFTQILVILYGNQGTGKSIFTSFIYNFVLGTAVSVSTSHVDCLTKQFNGNLCGKLFVNFEEFPTLNKDDFCLASDRLKNFVTEKIVSYEDKFIKKFQAENCNNFIITTNNRSPIKITSDDRRTFILKTSNKMVKNNPSYYNDLVYYMKNGDFSKKIGECFYVYCREHYNPEYKLNKPVMTDIKQDIISNIIPDPILFLKKFYFSKHYHNNSSILQDAANFKFYKKDRKTGEIINSIEKSKLFELYANFLRNDRGKASNNKIGFEEKINEYIELGIMDKRNIHNRIHIACYISKLFKSICDEHYFKDYEIEGILQIPSLREDILQISSLRKDILQIPSLRKDIKEMNILNNNNINDSSNNNKDTNNDNNEIKDNNNNNNNNNNKASEAASYKSKGFKRNGPAVLSKPYGFDNNNNNNNNKNTNNYENYKKTTIKPFTISKKYKTSELKDYIRFHKIPLKRPITEYKVKDRLELFDIVRSYFEDENNKNKNISFSLYEKIKK